MSCFWIVCFDMFLDSLGMFLDSCFCFLVCFRMVFRVTRRSSRYEGRKVIGGVELSLYDVFFCGF